MSYQADQLKWQVAERMRQKLSNVHVYIDPYSFGYKPIGQLVQESVTAALKEYTDCLVDVIVDELYSDEKFEKDIGLR